MFLTLIIIFLKNLAANHQIRMISEGSCDTEEVVAAKNIKQLF